MSNPALFKSTTRLAALAAACLPVFAAGAQTPWQPKKASLMTQWAAQVDPKSPLPEYPRPQLVREKWMSLNGLWQYQPGTDAKDQPPIAKDLSSQILVPFPVESALSGVMEHHERLWYRRTFELPADWRSTNNKILLHFGAVDYEAEVFLNGKSLTTHTGGYEAFSLDITSALKPSGPQELIVRVYDPTDAGGQPRGKQSIRPGGIMYTPTSGIWQSVWLEPVAAATALKDLHIVPDIDAGEVHITPLAHDGAPSAKVKVTVKDGSTTIATAEGTTNAELTLKIPNPKLWSPDSPFLYDVTADAGEGENQDHVASYFGMRKISLGDDNGVKKLFLNNHFVFEHGPLDQGFWPDGLYTAPTDDALKSDIAQTKAMGFNMIRKHIKVEPQRWYYWADKLGILVWQDMPSCNSYFNDDHGKFPRPPVDAVAFKKQLVNTIQDHWNHPAIVLWVTFNESQGQRDQDTGALVKIAKDLDPSRLVNEASGDMHTGHGDVFDIHAYPPPRCPEPNPNQALACGEFGGIGFNLQGHIWGAKPGSYIMISNPLDYMVTYSDFANRVKDYRDHNGLSAAVYTETTDVENEMNGLLTYDRIPKVPIAQIALANRFEFPQPQITTVLPTSEETTQTWKYTEEKPGGPAWQQKDFDDSKWKEAPGGFGTEDTPNIGKVGTKWSSSDIWLRRKFDASKLTPDQLNSLFLRCYHDEDVQIFINGHPAFRHKGFTTGYENENISKEARASITPDANNTLAVHCLQTVGGQYIDAGLVIRTFDESKIPK